MACKYCAQEIAPEATKCYRCGEYFGFSRTLRLFSGFLPIALTVIGMGTGLIYQDFGRRDAVGQSIIAIADKDEALSEAENAKIRELAIKGNLATVQLSADQDVAKAVESERAAKEAEKMAITDKVAAEEREKEAIDDKKTAAIANDRALFAIRADVAKAVESERAANEASKMAITDKVAAEEREKVVMVAKDAAERKTVLSELDSLAQREVALSVARMTTRANVLESAREELDESSKDYIVLVEDPNIAVRFFEAKLQKDPEDLKALKGLAYVEILEGLRVRTGP